MQADLQTSWLQSDESARLVFCLELNLFVDSAFLGVDLGCILFQLDTCILLSSFVWAARSVCLCWAARSVCLSRLVVACAFGVLAVVARAFGVPVVVAWAFDVPVVAVGAFVVHVPVVVVSDTLVLELHCAVGAAGYLGSSFPLALHIDSA